MQNLSPFHTELLEFLQRDVEQRIPEASAGLQKQIRDALSPTSGDAAIALTEIIESYQKWIHTTAPQFLERELIQAFPNLRMYRGLPRLYHRDNPAYSHIKGNFVNLASLKRVVSENKLFSLYRRFEPGTAKITLFSWVINDGLGDYMAAVEAVAILRERFPKIDLHLVALMYKGVSLPFPEGCKVHSVEYEKEFPPQIISDEILRELRSSDAILHMPTYYPHARELYEKLQGIQSDLPMPKWEFLGEYGFVESSWYHPRSGNRSMGLHFLEKGILVRKAHESSYAEIKNEQLLQWMFGSGCPGPVEIETYLAEKRFYLAYLATPTGGGIYLHALLKALEHEGKGIDLCVPNLGWFIQYLEKQNRENRPVLEGGLSVEAIEVYYQGKIHQVYAGKQGKRVRILCPGGIDPEDFRTLMHLSGEFVAVRGDQSFSEAVSANKVFYYDGREHARYFMKDLLALAENRISTHRSALQCFRGMGKAFLHNLPQQENEWVDESFFQEKENWVAIALAIGLALQDPDAIAGYKKLGRVITEELSCNKYLCHLIQRAVFHQRHKGIQLLEEKEMSLFLSDSQPFGESIRAIKELLQKTYL